MPKPYDLARVRFGAVLDTHLREGTRPPGQHGGGAWTREGFARSIKAKARNTVRNYCIGATLPSPETFQTMMEVLFGKSTFSPARAKFLRAYDEAAGVTPIPLPAADVPLPPPHFLGRVRDLAIVREVLLTSDKPVSILVQGSPGIGKTALTKAAAHDPAVAERFTNNRWFVALETASTSERMRDAIVRALGCEPSAGFLAALDSLKDQQGLVVLDNLETPWEADKRATEDTLEILAQVPGLALLASFRGRERVSRPVWTLVHPVEKLEAAAATELFCRIADRPLQGDSALKNFMAALDGVPLAIELVAHRAFGDAPLGELWAEWERIGAHAALQPGEDVGRLTSLAYSIKLSLNSRRMNVQAMCLFRLLGQLPAGLAVADRNSLVGSTSAFTAAETLRRIGLAIGDEGRIDLLSPIREFASREYRPEPNDEKRWIEHFLGLAKERGEVIGSPAGKGALAQLLPEFANIEAAFGAALDIDRRDLAMSALRGFARLGSTASVASPIFERLAGACRSSGDVLGEASCNKGIADIALARTDHEAARTAYEKALSLYQQVEDMLGVASCTKGLGDIALERSDPAVAAAAYEQALPLYRQVQDVLGVANCIVGIGNIARARSDHASARAAYEEALPVYRQVGDVLGEANCIFRLGDVERMRSDHTAARVAFEQALPLYRQGGFVHGEANCIKGLGDIALARSDLGGAQSAYEDALPLYRQFGAVLGEANCIKGLGDIALARSDLATAQSAYEHALPIYRHVGSVLGEVNCIKGLGDIAQALGDHETARTAYEQALPLYRKVGIVLGEANCIFRLGDIAQARSDYTAALRNYEQALPLYRQVGALMGEANCFKGLGDIARLRADYAAAQSAYEEALPVYRQVGAVFGEANCIFRLGDIAQARSDYTAALRNYEQALQLYREIGSMLGETNCIERLNSLRQLS